ncbi:MAG: hypothetical protein GF317_04925 [Candidatus Lokiarchaeota archaeon]|nr:hypothetical protein [Candidatus Lokiarchaeota archaeon]
MKNQYYNYRAERAILIALFERTSLMMKLFNSGELKIDYFYMDFHKLLLEMVIDVLRKHDNFEINKKVLFELAMEELEGDVQNYQMLKKVITKIYEQDAQYKNLQYRIGKLKELYIRRTTYFGIESIVDKISQNNFKDIEEEIKELNHLYTKGVDSIGGDTEGEVVTDLIKNIKLYKRMSSGDKDLSSIPIGVGWLQRSLGGSYNGETYVILGFAKSGKSLLLLEIGYQAARRGYVVAHFTIEMPKQYCINRFYSRMTKIPADKFKNADLSKSDYRVLKKKAKSFASKGGKYHIVSFPRGCKPCQIEKKLYRLIEGYGRVDLVTIDYLNDMLPSKETRKGSKEWDVIGDISWEIVGIAKSLNIPIWTANQAKKEAEGKAILTAKDFAFSSIPMQHANATIYITQTMEDKNEEIRRIGFIMSRDGADVSGQDMLYGVDKCCMINSVDRKRRMLSD